MLFLGVDNIKASSSRRSSFEAATGQRRANNSSCIDGMVVQTAIESNKAATSTVSTSSNEELTEEFDHLTFSETPAFASTTMINEILYRKRTYPSIPVMQRIDSNSSVSSTSSLTQDRLRPPPPSYSESRFSRRDSSTLTPRERRHGSAAGIYHNRVENRYNGYKTEALNNNTEPASLTKVRYVGGGSPSQSDSDYNSDDVQVAHSPTTIIDYDRRNADQWASTTLRERQNNTTSRYNHPRKVGIMSNSENTGSYFITDNLNKSNSGHIEKSHLYASTSALNHTRLVANTLPRSHNSSYSLRTPLLQRREPLMSRFFNDGRGHLVDGANVESLV